MKCPPPTRIDCEFGIAAAMRSVTRRNAGPARRSSTTSGRSQTAYFSLGAMTKVDALEGIQDPKELLAQIA